MISRVFLAFASVVVFSSTALAEVDRTKRPEAGVAPAAAFPEFSEHTLSNGLKVFIVESKRQPTVTLRLLIKSGSLYDGSKTGLAGLTAGLLDRGTTHRTAQQFAQELDFFGARFGAGTDEDSTSISIFGLVKFLPKMIDLFTDAVFQPLYPEDELAKEKKKIMSALAREKQQPSALAPKLRDKLVFGDHPYGAFATETTVDAITRDDLVAFHAQHFLANRATLAVVGDVKAADVLPVLEKAFGGWKPGTSPAISLPEFPNPDHTTISLVDRPGSVQSTVVVAAPGVARNNPDYPELSVVNSTLGGGFSGRLFQNLRERNGFTYGASSRFAPQQLGGLFAASSDVRNAVTEPAVVEMLNELKRIREQPIDEKELAMQRDYLAGNYLLSLENPGTTAVRVQEIEFFGLPADYYKSYARRVTAVTPEKAQELARKYLRDDKLTIVVVGEGREVKPMLEKLGPVTVYNTDLNPVPVPPAKP
jgi:zinc protease